MTLLHDCDLRQTDVPLDNPQAAASALADLQILPLCDGSLACFTPSSPGARAQPCVWLADETEKLLMGTLGRVEVVFLYVCVWLVVCHVFRV